MDFWNRQIETMSREDIEALQLKHLKALSTRLYDSSPFYHGLMRREGLMPTDIKTLADIRKMPCTKKSDLRDNYPDKLFMVPQSEVSRYHVSSGTTGKPTVVGYTRRDLEVWAESLARCFRSFGMGDNDVLQVSNGYGLFSGGLGMHYGAEKLGAGVLPASTGNTNRQVDLMVDLPVTAIACTPSYMIHIAEVAEKRNISIRNDTKLKYGILGAEPWSENMRRHIEDKTGIQAQNCYGASELSGPLFTECSEQQGIHVWGDFCLIEILDKNTGEPVAEGETGEMVITMLQREAMPIIRYRIGDISSLVWDKCSCGRTHPRLQRLTGRVDDMLIVRGINIFPSQIEHVIGELEFLSPHYQITLDATNFMDRMQLEVELDESHLTDDMVLLNKMSRSLDARIKDVLNVKAEVKLLLPGSLPRFEGKSKRVIDNRVYN